MICGPSVLASQSIFESQHMSQEWEYSLIQWVSCEKTQGRFLLLDISTHVRHMIYLIRCWFKCLGNTTNTTFSVTRTITHTDVLIHCCSKHLRHLLPEQVSRSCGMPIYSMYCISTNTSPNGPSVGKYPSTMDYSWMISNVPKHLSVVVGPRRSHFWWKEALCRLPLPSPPGVRDGQLLCFLCFPDYKTWKNGNPRRIPISIISLSRHMFDKMDVGHPRHMCKDGTVPAKKTHYFRGINIGL